MTQQLDYDFALQEIRRNMHDPRGSKTAIMVGAGFSRNAISKRGSGKSQFPDWATLTKALVDRLYTNTEERNKVFTSTGATSSALRLAQEFEAAHGRPALIDLVRESIPGEDFIPSSLHKNLMALNWADVFTTNYDTLLERSTLQEVDRRLQVQRYDTVFTSSDLPLARRPRIIKLHGTLPDLSNLILTEDDFRLYPINHAPLVNAVRASLTENIFCLFGFSGDDPNFLAWTGWIRDVLKKSSHPIYLFVGTSPKPFQRKLLEERNIVPIPFCDISGCPKYTDAFAWLFTELSKPIDELSANWNLGPHFVESFDKSDGTCINEPFDLKGSPKESWIKAAILWRQHRLQYKGWHILYRIGITRLWNYTRYWLNDIDKFIASEWEPYILIFILRELTWRISQALQPLPDDLVKYVIDPSIEIFLNWKKDVLETSENPIVHIDSLSIDKKELNEAYIQLLLELLRHARETGEGNRFDTIKEKIKDIFRIESIEKNRDEQQFVIHQSVLWMLASFEHDNARSFLLSWQTSTADDIWAIRRAGLMLECGLSNQAIHILTAILNKLSSIREGTVIDYSQRSAEGLALNLLWSCSHLRVLNTPSKTKEIYSKVEDSFVSDDNLFDQGSSILNSNYEEPSILKRLRELRQLGCDPHETLDWLQLQNQNKQHSRPEVEEFHSFEVGKRTKTTHINSLEQLTNAYRAIRFIEEASSPLSIAQVMQINISRELYCNAANTIASWDAREGIGLILRSRDTKLIKAFLSRTTIAALTLTQLSFLKNSGLSALQRSIQKLGPSPTPREDNDHWWENQLGLASIILSRILVRLSPLDVDEIAHEAISLASNKNIWNRFSITSEVVSLIKKSMESINLLSFEHFLTVILKSPIPGNTEFPEHFNNQNQWYDPIGALKKTAHSSSISNRAEIKELIESLFKNISIATGNYRKYLIHRGVSLFEFGVLTDHQQKDFVEALFSRTDEIGFPLDSNLLDSFILYLPTQSGISEKKLFHTKYIEQNGINDDTWFDLSRTVERFDSHHAFKKRSIKWNTAELKIILEKADTWLDNFITNYKETLKLPIIQSAFADMAGMSSDRLILKYHEWLEAVENVILLAPNVKNDLVDRTFNLLQKADANDLKIIKTLPCLAFLDRITQTEATALMINAMKDRNPIVIQQACSGIVRWSEFSSKYPDFPIPESLFDSLATIISTRRHEQLPLLIWTSNEVLKTLDSNNIPDEFINQLLYALKILANETSYNSLLPNLPIEEKIYIRIRCAQLIATLLEHGIDNEVTKEWMDIVENDKFNEVRLALS